MRQRAISAAFFVVAMVGGVFGGALPFFILFTLISAGCLWELTGLLFQAESNHLRWRKVIGTLIGLLPFLVCGAHLVAGARAGECTFVAGLPAGANPTLVAVMGLVVLVFLLFILEMFLRSAQPFTNIGHYLLGILYIGVPFAALTAVAGGPETYMPFRVFGLLLLTWTNDTMAYVVGSKIGKNPFFARISPKKTWEGTLGGIVFAFVAAFLLARWIPEFTLAQWMALAACVAIFGTTGDLVESLLKRSVNIKDSGSILPGHGGFLDRFDSFIFVLPFVWLVLLFV